MKTMRQDREPNGELKQWDALVVTIVVVIGRSRCLFGGSLLGLLLWCWLLILVVVVILLDSRFPLGGGRRFLWRGLVVIVIAVVFKSLLGARALHHRAIL